ncbi:uncharacterized protein LOC117114750 [Anneissia japonica]|uniref:uncharacterized protein LOC117114750 n=1 Tax=Anneissia japonica TaxID=1529436 RepID=UPI00142570DA|nr:uncharacterized protein LOC117114750 [Anneissia japonica]XP_033114334.1 uncharacterized protein LOC117114750 [Anneissia japonica]XP_033114335.1 uncharacterized protein LOC117114750 [Anneissia japonica]
MSKFCSCLQTVCRLCGCAKAIKEGRQPLMKENFSRIIMAALEVDVSNDDVNVHPPYICQCCELKLKRWKTKMQKNMKANCNITVMTFNAKCIEEPQPTLKCHEEAAKKAGLLSWCSDESLQILRLNKCGKVVVTLTIFQNFTWKLIVSGVECSRKTSILEQYMHTLCVEDTERLCHLLASKSICVGNGDFGDLVNSKRGPDGQIPLKITSNDRYFSEYENIRHNNCHLLVEGDRCHVCRIHRTDLAAMRSALHRKKCDEQVSPSSTIPNKFLTRRQLENKAVHLQMDRRSLKRRNTSLEDRVNKMYNAESEVVPHHQSTQLMEAFNACTELDDLPDDSPAKLLWEQQKISNEKGKQMRWHPAIIRWCIALQNRSASAYNLMRETGFLRLPHPRTLHPYSHFADTASGFCPEMLQRIVSDIGLNKENSELKKDVSLMFDEMKIKSGLGFSSRSGQIVGFTDVGTLGNEINAFERRCKGEEEPPVATHVLVLMLRGIFCKLHAPVGYYPTKGASSDELFSCLWEAVEYVETAGFRVRAFISDGASRNRKFYRLHSTPGSTSITYVTHNEIDPTRNIYFICDVPHLMKTTRNNFENSKGASPNYPTAVSLNLPHRGRHKAVYAENLHITLHTSLPR